MSDPGTIAADKAQKDMERRFRAIYREAQEDIIKKLDAHTKRLYALDEVKRAQVEAGTLSPESYKAWLRGQVFIGNQWKDKVDSVATSLLYANQQANDMIEGKKRAVFGENATYQAYSLEHDAGMDLSFGIYDSATVTRLIKEQPELLPRKVVNGVKDKAWNRTKIANAVTQGIIQGEGIAAIAKRIARQVGSDNMEAMTRYARTAMTGAQNAGRIEMLHEARAMGINVKKKWLATLDKRTRDAHRNLDGQVQEIDKPFRSDFGDIDYPGDFHAHPANVYNCRCTLIYEYPEYMPQNAQRRAYNEDRTESTLIQDMTYNEWKSRKAQNTEKSTNIFNEYIDYSKITGDRHTEQIEIVESLAKEFKTKLKEIRPGSHNSAGNVQISGTIMNLSDMSIHTAIHEFAHTISLENQTKFGLYQEADFWKEIKKIRTQYKKAAGEISTKWISTYEHSNKSADEFFAEAFTQAYMHEHGMEIPSQYGNEYSFSLRVLELTRKYFGR